MKKYTAIHRILHFGIGVAMLVLFCTGFLRMKWMGKKNISQIVEGQLNKNHVELPKDSLKIIGKQLLEPMWQWHVYFAYAILFLFTIRIIYMFAKGIRFPNPFSKQSTTKEKFQGSIYFLFYFLVLVDICTGFYLLWGNGDYKEIAETIHKYSLYWFPIFFILHILGIFLEEITHKSNIVSKMINGKE